MVLAVVAAVASRLYGGGGGDVGGGDVGGGYGRTGRQKEKKSPDELCCDLSK